VKKTKSKYTLPAAFIEFEKAVVLKDCKDKYVR